MAKTTVSDYFRDDVAMARGLLKALKTSNREAMLAKSIILNVMDLILLELQESVWKIYDVEKDETELGRRMLVCRGLKKDYARLMEKLFEELDGADDQLDEELELVDLECLLEVAGRKLYRQTPAYEILRTGMSEITTYNAELYEYVLEVFEKGYMEVELAERLLLKSHQIHMLAKKLVGAVAA